jgi:hypothetical protein
VFTAQYGLNIHIKFRLILVFDQSYIRRFRTYTDPEDDR